jgi:eukaryotic-like serine/threonine-protein kinase
VEARYDEAAANWDKAIQTYQALFSFFPDTIDYGLFLASVQSRAGKGKDALRTLSTVAQAGPQAKDDPRVDLATSEAASALGDNRLRRDGAETAAVKAARQGATLLVARARAQECRALANLGENDRAQAVCEEGRRIYAAAGDRGGLARILHAMAEVPLNRDDLVTAEKLYRQSLSLTQEIGDKQGTARELINLALISKKRGDLARAQSLNEQSLQSYTEAGDQSGVAGVSNNLGNLFLMQGRTAEARQYYERSLAYSREEGNKGHMAFGLTNIGETLSDQGDLAGAAAMLQQAVALRRELGEKSYAADALVTLGHVIEQQGDLDQARKNYLEALSLQEQLGEKGSTAVTRTALARLDCYSGMPAEAESLARAALEVSLTWKLSSEELRAETALSNALASRGKLEEARQVITPAFQRSRKNLDVGVRLACSLAFANILAASRNWTEAGTTAHQTLDQAHQLGLLPFELEASLFLGRIEMLGKDPASGRARIEELQTRARNSGFLLIARQAAALVAGK